MLTMVRLPRRAVPSPRPLLLLLRTLLPPPRRRVLAMLLWEHCLLLTPRLLPDRQEPRRMSLLPLPPGRLGSQTPLPLRRKLAPVASLRFLHLPQGRLGTATQALPFHCQFAWLTVSPELLRLRCVRLLLTPKLLTLTLLRLVFAVCVSPLQFCSFDLAALVPVRSSFLLQGAACASEHFP